MYIPSDYQQKDRERLISHIRSYSFGLLIDSAGGQLQATHLPFVTGVEENELFLFTHLARANPQAALPPGQQVLTIFQGPHAYISPLWYEKRNEVPTWNYVSVHAYGSLEYLHDESLKMMVLEKTINFYDQSYMEQWKEIRQTYGRTLLPELTAIKIKVERLEGKEKLSQNKSETDRATIIRQLKQSDYPEASALGKLMEELQR